MVAPKLVLIDVDTGVDDAWALAMIIKAEHTHNVRVLGITTVSGNTSLDNATRNTVRVLETLHRTDVSYIARLIAKQSVYYYDYLVKVSIHFNRFQCTRVPAKR